MGVWLLSSLRDPSLAPLTGSEELPPRLEEEASLPEPLRSHATARMGRPAVAPATEPSVSETNCLVRLLIHGEAPEPPSPEEIGPWLELNGTNAASLLAVRQAGGGVKYLKEALEAYPNDPRVLVGALALDDEPEAKRDRLDRFKEAAPDNALAWVRQRQGGSP